MKSKLKGASLKVSKTGGMCMKFVSPGTAGVPDRIIITATGKILFVELKTETGHLSKIQMYTIGEMKNVVQMSGL